MSFRKFLARKRRFAGPCLLRPILFSVLVWAAVPAQAHCKWRHPGHCISGGIEEIGNIGEDILGFGGDVFDRGIELADELADETIRVVTEIGEEFEKFICNVAGREPGENCNVSAGVAVNSDGTVVLTTGQGQPSETPPVMQEFDVLAWERKMELQDFYYQLEQFVSNPYQVGLSLGLVSIVENIGPQGNWIAKDYFNGQSPWSPTDSGTIRVNDDGGWGLVGARRFDNDGSPRLHTGTDYLTKPGENIKATVDGVVVEANQMSNGLSKIVIRLDSGAEAKILYATPHVSVGDMVRRDDIIASAEDLHSNNTYPTSVSNHIHIEYSNKGAVGHPHPLMYFSPDGKYYLMGDRRFMAGMCLNRQCFAPSP